MLIDASACVDVFLCVNAHANVDFLCTLTCAHVSEILHAHTRVALSVRPSLHCCNEQVSAIEVNRVSQKCNISSISIDNSTVLNRENGWLQGF